METTNTTKGNEMNDYLIGVQGTTGKKHLTTKQGQPRCGTGRATRYKLFVYAERKSAECITCARCKKIAEKEA